MNSQSASNEYKWQYFRQATAGLFAGFCLVALIVGLGWFLFVRETPTKPSSQQSSVSISVENAVTTSKPSTQATANSQARAVQPAVTKIEPSYHVQNVVALSEDEWIRRTKTLPFGECYDPTILFFQDCHNTHNCCGGHLKTITGLDGVLKQALTDEEFVIMLEYPRGRYRPPAEVEGFLERRGYKEIFLSYYYDTGTAVYAKFLALERGTDWEYGHHYGFLFKIDH